MILIFNWHIMYDEINHTTANIYITDGVTPMMYLKGGLDEVADQPALQTLLNGMESTLYAEALASGTDPTPTETAAADRLIYLTTVPNAKLVFTVAPATLVSSIAGIVSHITGLSAAEKNQLSWLLTVCGLVVREEVLD